MSAQSEFTPAAVGQVLEWPEGFAMSLGLRHGGNSVVRCCEGHDTPEAAKSHGITRLLEVALAAADRDVATWKKQVSA